MYRTPIYPLGAWWKLAEITTCLIPQVEGWVVWVPIPADKRRYALLYVGLVSLVDDGFHLRFSAECENLLASAIISRRANEAFRDPMGWPPVYPLMLSSWVTS